MNVIFNGAENPVEFVIHISIDMEMEIRRYHDHNTDDNTYSWIETALVGLEDAIYKRMGEELFDTNEFQIIERKMQGREITLKIQFLTGEAYTAAKIVFT